MPFAAAQGSLWTRPSGQVGWPFEIDRSHPEAIGLEECIIATPMGMVDLINGHLGSRAGSADPGAVNGLGGYDGWFDGDGDYYTFPNNDAVDSTQPFALVWEGEIAGFIDLYSTISLFVSSLGGGLRLMARLAANNIYLGDSGTILGSVATPAGVAITDRLFGVWSYDPASGHEVWINGLPCSSTTPPTAGVVSNVRRVGATSGSHDYYGSLRQVRRYSRSWSHQEAIAFWAPQTRDALFMGNAIRPGVYGGPLFGGATGAGQATGGAVPQVDVSLMADGFAVAGGSAHLSSSIPPTMVADSRYTVRAPIRDYRVAMPQRNRAS